MIGMQEVSYKLGFSLDITGSTATCAAIDTNGPTGWNHYNYLTVLFILGNIAADMTALKLQECDTSGGSYTDVTGADWSSALPTAAGSDSTIRAWNVNLGANRKRFFKVVATAGAGATIATALAILSRANVMPSDNTERNLAALLTL